MLAKKITLRSLDLRLVRSAAELQERTRGLIASHEKAVADVVAAAVPGLAAFASKYLAQEAETAARSVELVLPALVHGDAEVREASTAAKKDLYRLFGASGKEDAVRRMCAGDAHPELPYFAKKFKLRSVGVLGDCEIPAKFQGEAGAQKVAAMEEELSSLCSSYEHNINRSNDYVDVEVEGLLGMPAAFLAGLEPAEGRTPRPAAPGEAGEPAEKRARVVAEASGGGGDRYRLRLKPHVRSQVAKLCRVERTRRLVAEAGEAQCPENEAILERILELRHGLARARGFQSHADWKLRSFPSMGGSGPAVAEFCEKAAAAPLRRRSAALVVDRLTPVYEREVAELQKFWDEEVEGSAEKNVLELGAKEGAPLLERPWNVAFAVENYLNSRFDLEMEKLKVHFPLEETVEKILRMYSDMLGLAGVKRMRTRVASAESGPGDGGEDCLDLWHEDVFGFRIGDEASERYILFDLFPREGKFAHQCCYPLLPGGALSEPSCMFLGNLTPAEDDGRGGRQAYLRLREVQTLFHEIGHCMHAVCAETEHYCDSWCWAIVPWYGRAGIVGVEQDFLEVPSRMFEQWIQQRPEVLSAVSSSDLRLELEVAQKVVRASNAMKTIGELRYWAMAICDLELHGERTAALGAPPTSREVLRSCMRRIARRACAGGEANMCRSWYHMVQGYDAGYFGYGWSDVYAMDCFAQFSLPDASSLGGGGGGAPGVDAETGRRLRRQVLAPSASQPAREMMRTFLGRDEPDLEAFLRSFG